MRMRSVDPASRGIVQFARSVSRWYVGRHAGMSLPRALAHACCCANPIPLQLVDFGKLDMGTLKRYKKVYRLKTRQNVTKADLAGACARDFASRVVDEAETINNFLYYVQEQRDSAGAAGPK